MWSMGKRKGSLEEKYRVTRKEVSNIMIRKIEGYEKKRFRTKYRERKIIEINHEKTLTLSFRMEIRKRFKKKAKVNFYNFYL